MFEELKSIKFSLEAKKKWELYSATYSLCIIGKCTWSESLKALGTISCQQSFSTALESICYLESGSGL